MSPHVKAATIIAPFLLIGGYIAADYFQASKQQELLTSQAKQTPAYELELSSECKIPAETCVLKNAELVIKLMADDRNYYLESNRELKGVTIGLAQFDRVTRTISMQQAADNKLWSTAIRQLSNLNPERPLLMRLALESAGSRFYAEFAITVSGPWAAD